MIRSPNSLDRSLSPEQRLVNNQHEIQKHKLTQGNSMSKMFNQNHSQIMLGQVPSSNDHNSFQYPTVGRLESRLKTEFSPDPLNLN